MHKDRGKFFLTREKTLKDGRVSGFWDGSSKINGRSCCGVVIKGVDKNEWITISKDAVLLDFGTAMAPEVVGVYSYGHSGSRLTPEVCVKNNHQCIDAVVSQKSLMWSSCKKAEISKVFGQDK